MARCKRIPKLPYSTFSQFSSPLPPARNQWRHHNTNAAPQGERRIGALTAIKARAPVLGGNFGVWGGLFSTFDCAVKGVRQKEDPYNASMFIQEGVLGFGLHETVC